LPLFAWLFFHGRRTRLLAAAAVIASTLMVLASRSSTPVLTYAATVLALAMWPLRKSLRWVRWGVVTLLLLLQLSMSSPVWFVMNRASGVMGGSGWHRAMLVDNFVRHFFQWWLVGTRANPNWGWSMWDVDNAYVGAGLSGGLLSFVLFIAVLVYGFKVIGRARKRAEKYPREQSLIWALGAALFANAVAFFGIVYFDQAVVAWYALLAMVAVVPTFVATRSRPELQFGTALPQIEPQMPLAHATPSTYIMNSKGSR